MKKFKRNVGQVQSELAKEFPGINHLPDNEYLKESKLRKSNPRYLELVTEIKSYNLNHV